MDKAKAPLLLWLYHVAIIGGYVLSEFGALPQAINLSLILVWTFVILSFFVCLSWLFVGPEMVNTNSIKLEIFLYSLYVLILAWEGYLITAEFLLIATGVTATIHYVGAKMTRKQKERK